MPSVSSTSVGFQNPIIGGLDQLGYAGELSPLGGGIPGFIPQPTLDTDNNDEYSQTRFTLRNAWNTNYRKYNIGNTKNAAVTPFRAVTNSGDLLSRTSYSCGGSCQSFQSRPNLRGLKTHFGAIQSTCDASGIPPASCNVKYVYDGSDYTTYLKQKAINKNYNDLSNGGDDSSTSQVAWRAIRRY
jgi:hypothetical protein